MPNVDAKMAEIAEQLLRRPLTDDEHFEILRIADVMGMSNVHSFLHQLLVFKLHEDTLRQQFEDLRKFEDRLNERILGEGARAIASDMGEEIADHARNAFTEGASYYRLKGQIIVACLFWPAMALSYLLGQYGALDWLPSTSFLRAFMSIPAGWCLFLCSAIYTFLWVGDYWYDIRRKLLFKVLLGLQIFAELLLALMMV